MSGAKSRAPALRSNLANVRGLLPRWAWILIFLGLAIAYPYIVPNLLGGSAGDDLLDASVNTLGYIIMALGLNIVVGFAGLLDLGYVAFYAIGAFVIGWLGSGQFEKVHLDFLTDVPKALPGIHVNFVIVVIVAAAFTGAVGGDPGRTHAAPARRLPGHRDARVRGDRPARASRTGSLRLQRAPGHHADRPRLLPGSGRAQLPDRADRHLLRRLRAWSWSRCS